MPHIELGFFFYKLNYENISMRSTTVTGLRMMPCKFPENISFLDLLAKIADNYWFPITLHDVPITLHDVPITLHDFRLPGYAYH